nr:CrcB family protein [Leucobacter weissii]
MLPVALAGGAGAVLRYLVDLGVRRRYAGGPLGIFVVNVTACAALGCVAALAAAAWLDDRSGLILATGFVGGYSTLSTVAVDSAQLFRTRRRAWLALNTVGLFLVSLGVCWLSWSLVSGLPGPTG